MSSNVAEQMPPVGSGLMIVSGQSAVVVGEPGRVHAEFFATVKGLARRHTQEGSPRSGGWRGEQYDL